MDFRTPKFREFTLVNNHYQISKNEGNQNLKLSRPAWSLQKLALKRMNYFTNRSYRKAISKFWVILFIWIQQFVRFKRYLTFSVSDLWHLWHSIRVFLHGKISKVAADAEHLTLSMGGHLCMSYGSKFRKEEFIQALNDWWMEVLTEAVALRCSIKKVFLKISQN